jgi:hypothetical protein
MVAVHRQNADRFVMADETGTVLKYNTRTWLLEGCTVLGFKCYAVATSSARRDSHSMQIEVLLA